MQTYTITVHRMTGENDDVTEVRECTCSTHYAAITIFDWIIRGVSGHYRAWLVDSTEDILLRESAVLWDRPGPMGG